MSLLKSLIFILFISLQISAQNNNLNIHTLEHDPNGYILYCPCMGRFGNQADHFLGALSFAKGLNRTLVLPPWIEYNYKPASNQIPFDTYFKVEPLRKFHRVLTMHEFMKDLAPDIWPVQNRISLCYMARHNSDGCNAKEGNPFAHFWNNFNIDFVDSVFYRPMTYDVHQESTVAGWNEKFSSLEWPVLAFTGAPASFPVQKQNVKLHQYLQWTDDIVNKAKQFLSSQPRGPVIGVHFRNGYDWERACSHVDQSPNLFSAPQCLGYKNEKGKATKELCFPSESIIIKQLKRTVKALGATTIFVASDHDHMIGKLSKSLEKMKVAVVKLDEPDPHLELAILGLSNHFIGNCISSFSAFAKRERDAKGFPSSFWAFPLEKERKKKVQHIEL